VLQEEIEKHQREEKELLAKRQALVEAGIKFKVGKGVPEDGGHGTMAPGMKPTDTPEMFVSKIMQNQRRMEYTIKKYEEKQALARQEAGLEKSLDGQISVKIEVDEEAAAAIDAS